jgi:hypothetical protein
MRIDVRVDGTRLFKFIRNGQKRLAFSVIEALNKTGLEAQRAVQEGAPGKFTVRQRVFIRRQIAKIEKRSFASVARGQAYIEIEVGKVTTGRRELLLAKFEKGGERQPFIGHNIAVPVTGGPARPNIGRAVPRQWQFQNLAFRRAQTRKGASVWVSPNERAYIVPGVGVFRRTSRGSRMVYAFVSSVKIDQRLGFERTIRLVADRRFSKNMGAQIAQALARARAQAVGGFA